MKSPKTIKQRRTAELIPYARNARTHSDEQVAQIAASIREFGFNNPVLVDKDNGIIAGHGRVAAAHLLGLDTVPTVVLDHLSDVQRRAYILADNKLALNAAWDADLLSLEIEQLAEHLDINLLGFSDEDINNLMISGEGGELPDMPDADREPFQQMTFTLHDSQAELVAEAIAKAKKNDFTESENENANGNAIAFICAEFNGGR